MRRKYVSTVKRGHQIIKQPQGAKRRRVSIMHGALTIAVKGAGTERTTGWRRDTRKKSKGFRGKETRQEREQLKDGPKHTRHNINSLEWLKRKSKKGI